jgi:3-oxoacyl-(acyl-carrier-protein) synthase
MYIRATGNISPQKTFGHPPFLTEPVEYSGSRLACAEPEYKEIIDVKLIRRMSRIIRMGVAAAMECLQEAGVKLPDAIITGTAYGCLEDTGLFLTKMIEYHEELLTPTAFIQSTHNTIGAQIGLMLQCHNYNNTFVHRGFSFENALLDGMMLLKEKEVENVLLGAIDEITDISHAILNRMGLYKQEPVLNMELFKPAPMAIGAKGTIAGEGASFFLLANESSATDYAKLVGLKTFYKPSGIKEIEEHILSFLGANSVTLSDIDLVITGRSGNNGLDEIFDQLQQSVFSKNNLINYKHLCGEYPTSTAFALWVAANIVKTGTVPAALEYKGSKENKISKILIYNHYMNIHHSLILVSAC